MSFNADKKHEHEQLAEKALAQKDYAKAFFHTAKAAGFTFNLAESSDGKLAKTYLDDANELLEIAEKLKEKAKNQQGVNAPKREIQEHSGDTEDQPPASKWVKTEKPDVKLDDVIGLNEAKQIVIDALINPIKHPHVFKTLKLKPGTGLLLYGPPRTGKTMFAKAIANELNATFMHVQLNELKSKYVGDSEKNIAEMFFEARRYERCILFLDECEAILRKRGSQKISTVEQFLQEADGFTESKNQLFILLATNRPWLIDSAVLSSGRISQYAYIDLPNGEARKKIIQNALKDVPLHDDVDVVKLVAVTEGFSAGEIHHHNGGGVCDVARMIAARRWIKRLECIQGAKDSDLPEPVCWDDLEKALKKVIPCAIRDPEIIEKNKNWLKGRDLDTSPDEDEDE